MLTFSLVLFLILSAGNVPITLVQNLTRDQCIKEIAFYGPGIISEVPWVLDCVETGRDL